MCEKYNEFYKDKKPRDGYEWLEPQTIATPAEIEARINAIRKKYPFLSPDEVQRLDILRGLKDVMMRYANSSGGGKYHEFCRYLSSKYGEEVF